MQPLPSTKMLSLREKAAIEVALAVHCLQQQQHGKCNQLAVIGTSPLEQSGARVAPPASLSAPIPAETSADAATRALPSPEVSPPSDRMPVTLEEQCSVRTSASTVTARRAVANLPPGMLGTCVQFMRSPMVTFGDYITTLQSTTG